MAYACEEPHIRQLDVCDHPGAPAGTGTGDCAAHQWRAEPAGPDATAAYTRASGSSVRIPEHAWQRAQPALAVVEFMPRTVM